MNARATLLPTKRPEPGVVGGTPQLLLGPAMPSPVGAPANLLLTPDVNGREWTMVVVELARGAVERLRAAGRPATPCWPVLVANQYGRVGWDGMTSIGGAEAVTVGRVTITWIDDGDALHAVAVGKLPEVTPDRLLAALRDAGLPNWWADTEGHEQRWLLSNVLAAKPGARVPADTPVQDLRNGLREILGYPSLAAMAATGNYDPKPHAGRAGMVEFGRLRPVNPPGDIDGKRAIHHVAPVFGGGGMLDLIRSGALLSQRARRLLGNPVAFGSAEGLDRRMGKAGRVHLDVDNGGFLPPLALVWRDIGRRLLSRLDFAAAIEPMVPVPLGAAGPRVVYDSSGEALSSAEYAPQIGLSGGVDLFGPHGPDLIAVRDEAERTDVIRAIETVGVESLGGVLLHEAVVAQMSAVVA